MSAGNTQPDPPPGSCVECPLRDVRGNPVQLKQGFLGVQTLSCLQSHGEACSQLVQSGGQRLGPRLWAFPATQTGEFAFTLSALLLSSLVRLETEFGDLLALPERELLLWRSTRLCERAPLVLTVDGVRWRVLASPGGATGEDVPYVIPDHLPSPMKFYLKAFQDGGERQRQTLEAVARGEDNLQKHREIIYKVFHIMKHPPTRSHDLSKTPLINFSLGRCFHSEGLDLITGGFTFEETMKLVKHLHLETEDHHPETYQQVSVLDMYADRVARGVEKSVGWSQAAWSIPDQYKPANYREELKSMESKYKHLELKDPGPISLTAILTGAELSLTDM